MLKRFRNQRQNESQRFPLKESKHSDFILFAGSRSLEDADSTNPNGHNEFHLVFTRRRRTALSVSCPCLVFVRIFRKILSGVCLLSGFCPDFLSGVCLSGFCLSRICPLSGFCPDFKEKGCLVSVCPDFFYLDSVRCRDFVRIFRK